MSELFKKQFCPHCEHGVDDNEAEWEEDSHYIVCHWCGKKYNVVPIYKFEGFEINKICDVCDEIVEYGECACGDDSNE